MKLEEQLLELIRRIQEEVRINDHRIRQLACPGGGAGGDMLRAVYDPDGDGVVSRSGALTGPKINVEQIDGDLWILANARYDAGNCRFYRIDTDRFAFALHLQGTNNIPGETMQGVNLWRCVPGQNPIGDFGTYGGWEACQIWTAYKDAVLGGYGLEIDGHGTFPYARFVHLTHDGREWSGILTNLFADMSGRDDSSEPSWFIGRRDDEFVILRMPAGTGQGFGVLLRIDPNGNVEVAGTLNGVNISAHAARHGSGGADEIDVTGLRGELADPQTPKEHQHSAADIMSGLLDGDRLPGISQSKKGAAPPTGTPSGRFLKDDGTWGIPLIAGTATVGLITSNNVKNSNDAERTTTSTMSVKLKEIKVNKSYEGSIRIVWQMNCEQGLGVWGQVYKNGIAQGTAQGTGNQFPTSFSQDLPGGLNADDLIQIYVWAANGDTGHIRNMKLCFDWVIPRFDNWVLATPLACTNTDPLDATNQDP